ncbi:MAG: phospholipid carrier-dependent glycosyltransferase [Dysgonamonadaceae bacterium]|jgi:hypothetical protein|nr:phospholipid carrier-dependent glycosyltransferase [Dysgonamonadaceae bacterium]
MKTNKYIFPLFFLIVFAIIYTYTFDSKLDLNGDNASYLRLARNLSQGAGYVEKMQDQITPASHFPPGYPFFLSLFMRMGINQLIFFKVLNGILLAASLLIVYYIVAQSIKNRLLAFCSILLAAFSPHLLHFSGMVMSEMLFLLLTVLFFLSLFKCAQDKTAPFFRSPWFYLAILSIAASYHIRMAGIAGIFAVLVFFLFRKEWKPALSVISGIIILLIPWSVRNASYGIKSRYLGTIMTVNPWRPEEGSISSVGELVQKMIQNFDETVIKGFKEILFPFVTIDYGKPSGISAIIVGFLILFVIFYGAWNIKEIKWALIAFIAGQIGLFMLWHGNNGSRYVVPLAPFLFCCFYVGAFFLLSKLLVKWVAKKESKFIRHLSCIFFVIPLFMLPAVKMQAKLSKQPYPPAYNNYFDIAKEMNKQLVGNNIVCCCRKPELFTYYAPKIYAINYIYSTDPKEVIRDLIDKQVDYVILEQLGYSSTVRYLYPAIQQYTSLFYTVWHLSNPDTYLLKFDREKALELISGT